jgi:alkaline phosphatase
MIVGLSLGLALAGCTPKADTGTQVKETGLTRTQAPVAQVADPYYTAAQASVLARAGGTAPAAKARNIILFIGDGMGVSTVTAARIHGGQMKAVDGVSYRLAMETLPYSAFSKTYSHDTIVADSAATATALVSGVKTGARLIGVTSDAAFGNCASVAGREATTLFELAEAAGLATGLVSTTRLTHATPASAYAKTPNRDWEDAPVDGCPDIASQFVDWKAGDGFEVALAGGRSVFLPNTVADPEYADKTGGREDGRNLVEAWQGTANDRAYVWDKSGFEALDFTSPVRVLGLFEPSHMEFEADRVADGTPNEPSLAEMTKAAITRLSQDTDGYVLMVEGGRIDHAHHGGNAARALGDTLAFDEAIATALGMTNAADTLILVTADHSHTLVIQGYQSRNTPILGLAGMGPGALTRAADGKPYTTLAYTNGPGAPCAGLSNPAEPCVRPDPSEGDTTALDYRQQAVIPLASETHAGEDVPVFASGPGAELVRGVMEQHEIFHVLAYAAGLVGSAPTPPAQP